jgi:acyl-CoA thioester hydrolase
VPVRYDDLDTYGHVNNATVATYCEEARIDYFREVLPEGTDLTGAGADPDGPDETADRNDATGDTGGPARDDDAGGPDGDAGGAARAGDTDADADTDAAAAGRIGAVVASLSIDYERPIGPVDAVTVAVEVPSLGESSVPMTYDVRAEGETAATAEATLVVYDRRTGTATPMPEAWRDAVVAFEGLA